MWTKTILPVTEGDRVLLRREQGVSGVEKSFSGGVEEGEHKHRAEDQVDKWERKGWVALKEWIGEGLGGKVWEVWLGQGGRGSGMH